MEINNVTDESAGTWKCLNSQSIKRELKVAAIADKALLKFTPGDGDYDNLRGNELNIT